jgi:hypothetical protein
MGSNRVTGREGENDIALFGVLYNLFYNDLINEAFFQEKAGWQKLAGKAGKAGWQRERWLFATLG